MRIAEWSSQYPACQPIPILTLRDIGKERGGASVAEVVREVLKAVAGGAATAVTQSGQLLGDGARDLGKGLEAGGKAVGGAVSEGAAELGGAAKKLGSESRKVLGDVGNLLKRGDDK